MAKGCGIENMQIGASSIYWRTAAYEWCAHLWSRRILGVGKQGGRIDMKIKQRCEHDSQLRSAMTNLSNCHVKSMNYGNSRSCPYHCLFEQHRWRDLPRLTPRIRRACRSLDR
jgi:hypothetical protein